MITAKIAVATSPKKAIIFKRTSTEQNVTQTEKAKTCTKEINEKRRIKQVSYRPETV